MRFQIYGDDEVVEPVFEIAMKPCSEYSAFNLGEDKSLSKRSEELIQAHIDAKQFFCPEAFDLSLYGMRGDLKAKILTIDLESESPSIFEGL